MNDQLRAAFRDPSEGESKKRKKKKKKETKKKEKKEEPDGAGSFQRQNKTTPTVTK
jgi:hypothetical protein